MKNAMVILPIYISKDQLAPYFCSFKNYQKMNISLKNRFWAFWIVNIFSFNLIHAQDFGRLKLSNFTVKKGNQAAVLASNTKIIGLISTRDSKEIYQFNEEKIGVFGFVKYDENAQLIQEGTFLLPEVDVKKTYTRILHIELINDLFYFYYESHDKMKTSSSYIQCYSANMEPVGNRIFLTSEETGQGFLTYQFGYPISKFNFLFSKDRSKFCIHKSGNTGKTKNKKITDSYLVYDFVMKNISILKHNFIIEKGFQENLNIILSNNGTVSIFYKISDSDDENNFRYAFKRIGNGLDSSELKIPFDDIWLRNSEIEISEETLTICASFKVRDKNSDLRSVPDFINGLNLSKIDLKERKEIASEKILFENILKDKKPFKFNNGNLSYHSFNFDKVHFNSDGSLDIILGAIIYTSSSTTRNTGVFKKTYVNNYIETNAFLPLYLNIKSDLHLNFFKVFNLNSCSSSGFQANGVNLFYRKGNESALITLTDTTFKTDDFNAKGCMKKSKLKLTTFKFKENGESDKVFEAPYEVRKKLYLDLQSPNMVNNKNGKIYFYAKNWSGYSKDFVLCCYNIL